MAVALDLRPSTADMGTLLQRCSGQAAGVLLAALGLQPAMADDLVGVDDCLRAPLPGPKLELIVSASPSNEPQLRRVLSAGKLECVAQLQKGGACLLQLTPRPEESAADLVAVLKGNIFALDGKIAPPEVQRIVGDIHVNQFAEAPLENDVLEDPAPPSAAVCDPLFDLQIELKAIGAEAAWFDSANSGIITAVVDTGIQRDHEDLKHQVIDGRTMGCTGAGCDGSPVNGLPNSGHGTKVAGILGAGRCNGLGIAGVASNARMVSFNYGININEFRLSCAVQYALSKNAAVINLSAEGLPDQMPLLEQYLRDAEQKGVLFVQAAGNNKLDLENDKLYPLSSKLPNLLGVMGFGQGVDDASSAPDAATNFGKCTIHIAAPNRSGRTTKYDPASTSRYRFTAAAGTSWSTAYVSGTAALLKSRYPHSSYDFLKWRIIANATQDPRLKDLSVSEGRLNLARTLFPVTAAANVVNRSGDTPINWLTGIRQTRACQQVSIEGRFVNVVPTGGWFTIIQATTNDGLANVNGADIPSSGAPSLQFRVMCLGGGDTAESSPLPLR